MLGVGAVRSRNTWMLASLWKNHLRIVPKLASQLLVLSLMSTFVYVFVYVFAYIYMYICIVRIYIYMYISSLCCSDIYIYNIYIIYIIYIIKYTIQIIIYLYYTQYKFHPASSAARRPSVFELPTHSLNSEINLAGNDDLMPKKQNTMHDKTHIIYYIIWITYNYVYVYNILLYQLIV